MTTRRERFREQIRRLDATGPSDLALREGWVRARPGPGLAERIAAPLDLKDGVSIALIGGIGSGKTTEMLRVREILMASDPERLVVYLDVGKHASLASLKAQAMVGLAGIAIVEEMERRGGKPLNDLKARMAKDLFGHSYREASSILVDPYAALLGRTVTIPGVASRAASRFDGLGHSLELIVERALKQFSTCLLLFDGLDRLHDLQAWASLREDVSTLSALGVGAVYVAPVSFLLNPAHRDLTSMFDQSVHLPYLDIQDPVEKAFLQEVIRARTVDDILPEDASLHLVDLSGGALRDLLLLAQAAVQESYAQGEVRVTIRDVQTVADRFGRKLLLGVSEGQLATLQRLRKGGGFAMTTDATVALVVGRLVMFYEGPRFAVHPCVTPILQLIDPVVTYDLVVDD